MTKYPPLSTFWGIKSGCSTVSRQLNPSAAHAACTKSTMNDPPEERQEDPANLNVGLISDTESSLRVADQRDPNDDESGEPPKAGSNSDPLRPQEQLAANQGDVNPASFANYPQQQPFMPSSVFNGSQHAPGMFPHAQGLQPPQLGALSFSPESFMVPPSVAPPYHDASGAPPPSSPQHALATMQFYEARMRDHAAAYASAAASAAWAAALFSRRFLFLAWGGGSS